jgi:hypothetical protein
MLFATALVASLAAGARAGEGFLIGTWVVRCPIGHDDVVHDITRNHDCEKCGRRSVDRGSARVVCPVGHTDAVNDITAQHVCSTCGKQCRRN